MVSSHRSEIREKCGVVGVWTSDTYAPYIARRASAALQHRGQESAGLSVLNPNGKISTHKGMGLVPHVLTESVLKKLGVGHTSIAQNRYATFGRSHTANAQPIALTHGKFQLSLGHNGNIPTVTNIKHLLSGKNSASGDTELMTTLIHKERKNYDSWEETLIHTLLEFHGAYCLIMLTNDGSLFGIRDPYGIRPLCLGQFKNGWIIASESAALDAIGAEFIREVKPGEIIKITKTGQLISYFFGEPKRKQFCIFECIYFTRPDSFINGIRIRAGREASGRLLAKRIKQKGIIPDVVVPTFDSGYPAAKGVAQELGIPMVDAITTSHYVGRTFIQPGQSNRIIAVNGKHNIIPDEIIGKKIVIVDDSAVRLTTSTMLAKRFKEAGAKKIYMAFASPPVVNQCDLGIDMRAKKELPAARFEKEPFDVIEKKVANYINADEVVYLPVEETAKAFDGKSKDFYYTPFGGQHPIRDPQEVFRKRKNILQGKPKVCIFLSGKGTYLQDIIDGIEDKTIDAEIVGVVSNVKDAYGIVRAKKYTIPTKIIEYKGKLSNKTEREKYEEQLLAHVKKLKPDMILLSGWQIILGDTFLKTMRDLQIPVINHHPALLTSNNETTVRTSRGTIPVLRGAHVSKDAYDKKFLVTGISVHQVLPGNGFDVGPVIMKSEVSIHADETFELLKKRMDDTEHLLLPTAVKKIIHVIKHNIDISQGDFPW
jgi:amidophosphoribosyltransferase